MKSLLVFSRLRWQFVYQRPQHLMSRFARHYQTFFIEEPVFTTREPHWHIFQPGSNIHVCQPHTSVATPGFDDQQLPTMRLLVDQLVENFHISRPLVWLYTPMALPLLAGLDSELIIYDCMDELSAFMNAPQQLVQREYALLKAADLVFAGGPSLFRAKSASGHKVHLFPSSVDLEHFAPDPKSAGWPVQQPIPQPRLGYFGVIDERFDIHLIEQLAVSHPHWQIILVGPVVKIDPADLPRRPNIHYLGQRSYEMLPRIVAGWDVCLLPFALNDATRFISPTKTLEYMAAGKAIVSTPVADVLELYGDVVRAGQGNDFIAHCETALNESEADRTHRASLMDAALSRTSWDRTVDQMQALIVEEGAQRRSAQPAPRSADLITRTQRHPPPVVIIGAGPTGLSAAFHLGESSLLLEQSATVGGWCRSVEDRGFTFDYAGHIMFSSDPYVHELYRLLLGENVHWQDREAWIFSKHVYTRYPFQGALYGLPPEVVAECIVGAIEARVGPLSAPDMPNIGASRKAKDEPRNFEEFIYQVWGSGIARHFAIPYNRKLWAVPLSSMETSWLGGRVPMPDLHDMIAGALRPVARAMGPNARFGYPLRGGFQALMNGFLEHLRGPLRLNAQVCRVVPSRREVVLQDGTVHRYKQLISTMPLPLLVRAAGEEAPAHVKAAAARLRHVSVRCVNLGIGRADISDKHWIYYPEPDFIFHRIFVQGNASPYCNAPGGTALTCEITYSPDKPLPCDGAQLIERCVADCISAGLINVQDVIVASNQLDLPYAYVIYDHVRAEDVASIRAWANAHGILLAGRYGEWEYYNSDHAFLAGRKAAERALAAIDRRVKVDSDLSAMPGVPPTNRQAGRPVST